MFENSYARKERPLTYSATRSGIGGGRRDRKGCNKSLSPGSTFRCKWHNEHSFYPIRVRELY